MQDEIRNDTEPVMATNEPVVTYEEEAPTGDAEKGAVLGGVGGLVTGAIAGAGAGPVGAIIGAVVGGVVGAAASGIAVAAVDRIDDDTHLSGLPDDMSIDDADQREPIIVDRNVTPVAGEAASDAPIGVGVQEAIIATEPADSDVATTELATHGVVICEPIQTAKMPTDEGGVFGNADAPGTAHAPPIRATDPGWKGDNDANTINVNPSDAAGRGSYAYADEDKRKDSGD